MISQRIVSMDVNVVNLESSVNKCLELARSKTGAYICASNVHMCIESFDSPSFSEVMNNADLVIPDGKPLSWAQNLLGHSCAEQVRAEDLVSAICSISGTEKLKIGFYGGSSDELLERVCSVLKCEYPDITISYTHSPPFRPLTADEDTCVVDAINKADVDVLFVGVGCPKQERWMAEHKQSLSCVMLGVGAVFDFIAGEKPHAPRWVQRLGFEWLFRLCCEPRRLWRRYLRTNPRFIWYFIQQWCFGKKFKN